MQIENSEEEQKLSHKVIRLNRSSKYKQYTSQELYEKYNNWKDFPGWSYRVRKLGKLSALEKTQIVHAKVVKN